MTTEFLIPTMPHHKITVKPSEHYSLDDDDGVCISFHPEEGRLSTNNTVYKEILDIKELVGERHEFQLVNLIALTHPLDSEFCQTSVIKELNDFKRKVSQAIIVDPDETHLGEAWVSTLASMSTPLEIENHVQELFDNCVVSSAFTEICAELLNDLVATSPCILMVGLGDHSGYWLTTSTTRDWDTSRGAAMIVINSDFSTEHCDNQEMFDIQCGNYLSNLFDTYDALIRGDVYDIFIEFPLGETEYASQVIGWSEVDTLEKCLKHLKDHIGFEVKDLLTSRQEFSNDGKFLLIGDVYLVHFNGDVFKSPVFETAKQFYESSLGMTLCES